MDQTDVYFRQLCRLISRHTWLWTEMIVDTTLIHNPQVQSLPVELLPWSDCAKYAPQAVKCGAHAPFL